MTAFQPFDPRGEFRATRRNLPHWHQPGATDFATFRSGDSLPAEVQRRYAALRELNPEESFAWVERYLEAGSGAGPFRQPANAAIVSSGLEHFDGERDHLGAYGVMPNHVHALGQPLDPEGLTTVMHSWKSYTAHQLQRCPSLRGEIWQEESFDRIVRDEDELTKFTQYIADNPKDAHLGTGSYRAGHEAAGWLET